MKAQVLTILVEAVVLLHPNALLAQANACGSVRQHLQDLQAGDGQNDAVAEVLAELGPASLACLISVSEELSRSRDLGDRPIEAAARLGTPVVPALLRLLQEEPAGSYRHRFAERALARVQPRPVPQLTRLLHSSGTATRHAAARALASMDDPDGTARKALLDAGPVASPALLEILCSDQARRAAASEILVAIGIPASVDAIMNAGAGEGPDGREAREARYVRLGVWSDTLARMDRGLGIGMFAILADEGSTSHARNFAVTVLSKAEPLPTDDLIRIANEAPGRAADEAVRLLAAHPDPKSADAFLDGLRSGNPQVVTASERALGILGDTRVREPLIHLMFASRQVSASGPGFEAAIALGSMFDARVHAALLRCVRGECAPGPAAGAADALKRNGDFTGVRLGARYGGLGGGMFAAQVALAAVLLAFPLVGGSAAVVFLMALVGTRPYRASKDTVLGFTVAVGAAAAGSFTCGLIWAASADSLFGMLEGLMLLAAPVAVIGAQALTVRWMGRASGAGAIAIAGSFYLGFGLGWLWLRGYLGS